MSWSDIIDAVTDNPLDTIEGILKIRGAIQANNQSKAASDEMSALTAAEIDRNNEIAALYAEGGDVMDNNLRRLLDEYGTFGQVTPDKVDTFKEYFANQRAAEEAANIAKVDEMTALDEMRLKGYESAFREYADQRIGESENVVYGRDAIGKMNAPQTLDFAKMQDSLASKFWMMRSQNTKRALDNQYARVNARIPEGMENSTLRVQMERQFGDLAAKRSNEDMLAAIGDAQNYIAGLQQAASNQQNMTNAERNMERNLVSDILNRATGTLNNSINAGTYGQGFAQNINAQRGMAIDELGAQQNLRNNTALSDFYNGLSTVGAENKLGNTYLGQVQQLSTAPYTYAAQGANSIDNSNAFSALNNAAVSASNLASGNISSAGKWYNDFKMNYL